MTLLQIVSDVILRLTGGRPTEDTEYSESHIAAIVDQTRAALFRREMVKNRTMDIEAGWLLKEDCVTVTLEKAECHGDCCTRYKLNLSANVMDLPGDAGIVLVEICENNVRFRRTTAQDLRLFRHSRFVKFSKENPYYYRVGQDIYLLAGIRDLSNCVFTVIYVPSYQANDCFAVFKSEVAYPIPDYLLAELVELAVTTLTGQTQRQDIDGQNDGKSTT